jgi:hypothetical protein
MSWGGKKVVAWTPYGRKETVELLHAYLRRDHERDIVDEWWLCLNTDPTGQVEDLAYAYSLAKRSSWIKIKQRPTGVVRHSMKQRNTGYFYRYMTDPDSVFLRFDDDIVYVHELAISRLVKHKLATPGLCSFALIINNAVCSYFLQANGKIPHEWGTVGMYCMDPVGWANGDFAIKLHRMTLEHIGDDSVDQLYLYQDYALPLGEQFSVSCFASLGSVYAGLAEPGVLVPDEEESWLTMVEPRRLNQPNVIVGNALVSHYTFFTQHRLIKPTDILEQYRKQAERLTQ